MVLWQVTSYRQGLALEYQRLQAVARLQETYGQHLWRWKAPLRDLLALRLATAGSGPNPEKASPADAEAAIEPAESETPTDKLRSHLPQRCLVELSKPINPPNDRDQLLIATAAEILQGAERRGARLSQGALARELRERGYRVANERLRWLVATVQRMPTPREAS
jgi:hypothetical protein